jgi:hypothetical protein
MYMRLAEKGVALRVALRNRGRSREAYDSHCH